MKKYMILGMALLSGVAFAQTAPKLTAEGQRVKATYFHDNGQIAQEGYFKDGKLDGQWTSYDVNGAKKSIAEYKDGQKTGKWFFWSDKSLSEVDYSNSRIASVKNWKQDAVAKN